MIPVENTTESIMTELRKIMLSDDQIRFMVDRFLQWRLPADFAPDAGISFEPVFNRGTEFEHKHEPVGTNLLTAAQAEAMVRFMLNQ